MSDRTTHPPVEPRREVNWSRRLAIGGAILIGAILLALVLSAFLPRWWAVRIGNQVDQSTFNGVALGLFYGAVFTFLPLLVLWLGVRRRRPWKVWLAFLGGAILLAAPNLLTLSIVVGNGNAAHAGERILDTQASYFRASTLIGAILGAGIMACVIWLSFRRRSLTKRERQLREERDALVRERDAGADAGNAPE